MRSRKTKSMVALQQAEFDALPYSVQRKYFSSLERLQIRQQLLDKQHASGHTSRPSTSTSSSAHLHPSFLTVSSKRLSRNSHLDARCDEFSLADIDFFFSLPEKVRRLYFSQEEQLLFLERCQRTCPERGYDNDFERARQRFSEFHFGFPRSEDNEAFLPRGRSRRQSLSPASLMSPSQASSNVALAKETDSYHNSLRILGDMSPPRTKTRRTTSMRRTVSLSNKPARHHRASTAMRFGRYSAILMANPRLSTMPTHTRHQQAQSLSTSRSTPTSFDMPTSPASDPEATHYKDPEARKKLRMYLASPQKFDEAIEFGFPSTAESDAVTPHYQLPTITHHSRKFSRDMQNFLSDRKLSLFEDSRTNNQGLESDEEVSVPDVESPITPSSAAMSCRLHSRQLSYATKFSSDMSPVTPTFPPSGENLNRRMTLRMTLTRPDLRADEDQLYGWQTSSASETLRDDPLALEDLVLTDDMTGTTGPFYVKPKPRGNLVTRMLKRASFRGR